MNVSVSKDAILEPFYKFFERGTHGLMGPSGCGKTTLLDRIFKSTTTWPTYRRNLHSGI